MRKAVWKKAAIASVALLTLAGGATSAFADGKGKGNDKGHNNGHDKKNEHVQRVGNGLNGNKGFNLNFKDEQDLKWALEHIIRLASKGVFNGYEDGTFKPQQSITRIESIVAAVRLMGLREQAESDAEMNTQLNFKDADKLESKYPWAVGYVAVALEKDLFSETDSEIQPDKAATRLFAATLLVKALGLEAEAKAKSNTHLSFKDADSIPAGSVGYVAVALEKGLITGYENNMFRPNQPVTRAELAALLDRTDEQLPDHDAQAITGKLKAAPSNGAIVVVKSDNSEVTVQLAANAFIFRNNVKVSASALQAGDEVLMRTYDNKAVFIEVTKAAAQTVVTTETGKFNSVSFNAEGKIATVSITKDVNGGTQAFVFNAAANVAINGSSSQLTTGQPVELTLTNGVVTAIKTV